MPFLFRKFYGATCCLFVILFCMPAVAEEVLTDDLVLLRDGDLLVTKEDLLHYIQRSVPPEEQQQLLSRQDRLVALLQNVHMTRALAARADEFDVSIDEAQLQWDHEFNRDTKLAKAIQEVAVKRAQKDVDWVSWAKEVYVGENERFLTEAEVDAAHILISTEGRDDAEALTLAENVRKKALEGAAFDDLAREYSSDIAANKKGGELGLFKHGAMVKPFSDVAFAMTKPGSVSEPVKTRFGYHIIKFNKKTSAQKKAYNEVESIIINTIKARMAEQTRVQLLTEVRSKQGVQVNEELLENIRVESISK